MQQISLAPPGGNQGLSQEVFVVTGIDITITAFTGVTGNPTPNSTWTRDSVPPVSGRIYNTDNTGVLVISNVLVYQTLVTIPRLYTTCSTMSPSPTASPFHCKYSVSATPVYTPFSGFYSIYFRSSWFRSPQSVSVVNDSFVLTWLNPVSVGVSALVRFSIELAKCSAHVSKCRELTSHRSTTH